MSKIKVAELFYSLQGEGQYLGTPSIFLRVFGCNFQCAGFGMQRNQISTERLDIDPSQYSSYNDLP
jgi:organic radical activating enzyme